MSSKSNKARRNQYRQEQQLLARLQADGFTVSFEPVRNEAQHWLGAQRWQAAMNEVAAKCPTDADALMARMGLLAVIQMQIRPDTVFCVAAIIDSHGRQIAAGLVGFPDDGTAPVLAMACVDPGLPVDVALAEAGALDDGNRLRLMSQPVHVAGLVLDQLDQLETA